MSSIHIKKIMKKSSFFRTNFYTRLWFKYHNLFFNRLVTRGGSLRAFNKFLKLKKQLKNHENINPFLIFLTALMNAAPTVHLLPIKRGRQVHGVAIPINEKKKLTVSVGWSVMSSKNKSGTIIIETLANNMIFTIYNKGPIIEKKQNVYLIGERNRHLVYFFK